MHVMNAVVMYSRAFSLHFTVFVVGSQIKDILENTMFFGLLWMRSRATYIRCALLAKFLLNNEKLISLLGTLNKEVRTGESFGISYFGYQCAVGVRGGIFDAND